MHYLLHPLPSLPTPEELGAALDRLPSWRREQALRFKHTQGQAECALSYHLLCEALSRFYGISRQPHFLWGRHGKPTLEEYPHIHFNLSHCKAAIAVAVSEAPVGIDVECVGRAGDSLMRYALSPAEYGQVTAAADPSLEFAKFWTRKEALVKLIGSGITNDLKDILSIYDNVELLTVPHREEGFVLSIASFSRPLLTSPKGEE